MPASLYTQPGVMRFCGRGFELILPMSISICCSGHNYSVCQVLICSVILFRLIKYIPQRLEHRDRWMGALQNTEVPLVLINGPADPISGRHAADGYALLLPFPIWISKENSSSFGSHRVVRDLMYSKLPWRFIPNLTFMGTHSVNCAGSRRPFQMPESIYCLAILAITRRLRHYFQCCNSTLNFPPQIFLKRQHIWNNGILTQMDG